MLKLLILFFNPTVFVFLSLIVNYQTHEKNNTLLLNSVSITNLIAQDYFPTNTGLKQENNNYTAFTNAVIFITPNEVIKNGTLLIQDGKVIASGSISNHS